MAGIQWTDDQTSFFIRQNNLFFYVETAGIYSMAISILPKTFLNGRSGISHQNSTNQNRVFISLQKSLNISTAMK